MLREARLGIARLGATRLGDYRPYVFLSVDGVARRLRIDHLTVRDTEGGIPNTATMRVSGFDPQEGQAVRLGLGALDAAHSIFAGHILKTSRIYEADNVENVAYDLTCISYEWRLNRHKVNARFMSQSATTIATSLIASYAPDFTVANVAAGLPSLEEFTLTNEDLTDALDRLTDRIGGAWYVDESKDLHLFISETLSATAIDDTHRDASQVRWDRDLSPVRTRVVVEGAGVTAAAPAVPGDTALAVDDLLWYDETGGTVTSGPQRITYTGVVAGGAGALIGTTITPTNGPSVTRRAQAGSLGTGDYTWKVTFVTASGETLPSPASIVATFGGAVNPPASAPTVAKLIGGNLSAGAYQWKVAFLDGDGNETLASGASASLTMDSVADPSSAAVASLAGGGTSDKNGLYNYKYTFTNGSVETAPSSLSNDVFPGSGNTAVRLAKSSLSSPPAGWSINIYVKSYEPDSSNVVYRRMAPTSQDATYYYDDNSVASVKTNPAAPSSSTATYRSASLTSIPVSLDANITKRRIYRTAANGSTFKKVADLNDNTTTTYTDTLADASLGSTELGTATSFYTAADLSSIPIGPSGTTQRKIYRTAANGSTYGLQSTIANNTSTTATDTTADGSLGAAPPSSDTSGLTSTAGEVAAGSTSIPVTSTAAFRSAGGWAFIGSMPIRYTGYSGTALTGIPALGQDGSLGTTVKYGVEIVAAPMLVGIPASGAGAILYDIASGDEVNLLVTRDDLAAQSALTELLTASGETPADGVVEEYIQDRRLSSTEATARAQAQLDLVKDPLVSVRYETRDRFTRAGRDVTFTSTVLGLTGTFKIQSVTISDFDGLQRTWPRRQVNASSRRFTFEALLRQGRA